MTRPFQSEATKAKRSASLKRYYRKQRAARESMARAAKRRARRAA